MYINIPESTLSYRPGSITYGSLLPRPRTDRLYRLDGVLPDSDDDPDGEENATTGGADFHVMGADEAGYGVSLLQAAVDDTAIASVLPPGSPPKDP